MTNGPSSWVNVPVKVSTNKINHGAEQSPDFVLLSSLETRERGVKRKAPEGSTNATKPGDTPAELKDMICAELKHTIHAEVHHAFQDLSPVIQAASHETSQVAHASEIASLPVQATTDPDDNDNITAASFHDLHQHATTLLTSNKHDRVSTLLPGKSGNDATHPNRENRVQP